MAAGLFSIYAKTFAQGQCKRPSDFIKYNLHYFTFNFGVRFGYFMKDYNFTSAFLK